MNLQNEIVSLGMEKIYNEEIYYSENDHQMVKKFEIGIC